MRRRIASVEHGARGRKIESSAPAGGLWWEAVCSNSLGILNICLVVVFLLLWTDSLSFSFFFCVFNPIHIFLLLFSPFFIPFLLLSLLLI